MTIDINIVASQKVVHPLIKRKLEKQNIIVLERLGGETVNYLQAISESQFVSSLSRKICFGSLTSLKLEILGKKTFLLLKNEKKPFWSFLICNYNEEALSETKIVCEQAITTLYRLLKNPKVCFGAGCTEMCTLNIICNKVLKTIQDISKEMGCSVGKIISVLKMFHMSISAISLSLHQSSKLNCVTDSLYNHLWDLHCENFPLGNEKCLCTAITASDVTCSKWKLSQFQPDLIFSEVDFSIKIDTNKLLVLDDFSNKVNALSLAFESAVLLLKTSLCINHRN